MTRGNGAETLNALVKSLERRSSPKLTQKETPIAPNVL